MNSDYKKLILGFYFRWMDERTENTRSDMKTE